MVWRMAAITAAAAATWALVTTCLGWDRWPRRRHELELERQGAVGPLRLLLLLLLRDTLVTRRRARSSMSFFDDNVPDGGALGHGGGGGDAAARLLQALPDCAFMLSATLVAPAATPRRRGSVNRSIF